MRTEHSPEFEGAETAVEVEGTEGWGWVDAPTEDVGRSETTEEVEVGVGSPGADDGAGRLQQPPCREGRQSTQARPRFTHWQFLHRPDRLQRQHTIGTPNTGESHHNSALSLRRRWPEGITII